MACACFLQPDLRHGPLAVAKAVVRRHSDEVAGSVVQARSHNGKRLATNLAVESPGLNLSRCGVRIRGVNHHQGKVAAECVERDPRLDLTRRVANGAAPAGGNPACLDLNVADERHE